MIASFERALNMKRLLVVCCLAAVGYLAIPLIVDAQSGMAVMTKGESGMPEYVGSTGGKVHVSNYSTAPDGGAVRQSADEHGRAYVRSVSADGGIPEVTLGEMLGTETNRLATTATATAGGLTGAVTVPDSIDVPVPATALENRRGATVHLQWSPFRIEGETALLKSRGILPVCTALCERFLSASRFTPWSSFIPCPPVPFLFVFSRT
ncbi:MAG: hypothetical protein ACOX6T_12575 [Myxococcales bacterium]|jgi:hypothetical protein